jgi:hypothetical protein
MQICLRHRPRWMESVFLGLLVLAMPTILKAQGGRAYPVALELLAPTSAPNKIPTVTWGGWPIVLKMTANREIGIGTQLFDFPVNSDALVHQGFSGIVFEDPDECHSWLNDTCSVNETYLDFAPGGPALTCFEDIPGGVASLVLLADVGAGKGGFNLADRFKTVGYELDDVSHRTNVVASMVVGNGLVTPAVVTDLCIGPPPEGPCPFGGFLGQIGGEILSDFQALLDRLNRSNVTTLRAFVVNRKAPAQLSDLDADGLIGATDAELAGFGLLSREIVFRVKTLHEQSEFFFTPMADLDGNGGVECGDCSPGGGGLKPVPR